MKTRNAATRMYLIIFIMWIWAHVSFASINIGVETMAGLELLRVMLTNVSRLTSTSKFLNLDFRSFYG